MKEVVALVVAVTLIAFGWDRSYSTQFDVLLRAFSSPDSTPAVVSASTPVPAFVPPTPPPHDGSWMWQHKNTLDNDKPVDGPVHYQSHAQ